MKAVTKILTGAAGLAAVVGFASPAAAQYYPNPGYGYGNNSVGQVIGQILGYGRYPYGNQGYGYMNNNMLVDQCARAVEARLGGGYGYNNGYGGYGGYGYNNYGGGGRVQGITSVERKNSGVRVKGVATSGGRYGGGYGSYGYNQQYPDIRFNCKVDFNGRITDLDLDRINTRNYGYRGW